jgi:hypothetical protein
MCGGGAHEHRKASDEEGTKEVTQESATHGSILQVDQAGEDSRCRLRRHTARFGSVLAPAQRAPWPHGIALACPRRAPIGSCGWQS